ncbi:MAG TPA: DUF6688 family protein, partial [Bacteroidia bacterium]|nr:DUF6688 family protein [Bacteroidia bacterium]
SSAFAPAHRISILVLIILCLAAYYYGRYRKRIAPPIPEILMNCLLLIGIIFNVFLFIHMGYENGVLGCLPIILLFLLVLADNQKLIRENTNAGSLNRDNPITSLAWNILHLKPLIKFPLLLLLCLPVLVLMSAILLLFGQKPDSLIRAFTDTYKLGFSQLHCPDTPCGGHYLCTIAAKGHPEVVKPTRSGIRNGYSIPVNRQLLVSNAFEELIQERMPRAHRMIRNTYDATGGKMYPILNTLHNKWVSDAVYVGMKPLEWIFLLTLYCFDRKPENRIEKQYISSKDKAKIKQLSYY